MCVRANVSTVENNTYNIYCVHDYKLSLASMKCACAILLSVSCLNVHFYCTLYHIQHNFLKRLAEYEVCILNSSINKSENILIQEEQKDV